MLREISKNLNRRTGMFMVGTGVLALLAGAIVYSFSPQVPIMVPDSLSYLNFDPARPTIYPLFLRSVGINNIIAWQIFVFGLCAWVLGCALFVGFRSAGIGAAALIALFVNPEVMDFQLRTVGCPLIFVVAASVILRLRGEGLRKQGGVLLGCLLIWGAVVGGERFYARFMHGDQLTSYMGHHIFAKAALIDAAPLDVSGLSPVEQRLARALEVDYVPVREILRRADGTTAYPALLAAYEVCIQHSCTAPFRSEYGVSVSEFNSARARVGFARIRQNPLGFALLTWREYKNLWALNSRTHPWLAPEHDAFMTSARPLPLEHILSPAVFAATSPSRVAYLVRPAFITAGFVIALILICFGYAVAGRHRSDALLVTAFLSALSVELVFVFTAITAIGYGRYTMAMWPNMAVATIVAAGAILRYSKKGREITKGTPASYQLHGRPALRSYACDVRACRNISNPCS